MNVINHPFSCKNLPTDKSLYLHKKTWISIYLSSLHHLGHWAWPVFTKIMDQDTEPLVYKDFTLRQQAHVPCSISVKDKNHPSSSPSTLSPVSTIWIKSNRKVLMKTFLEFFCIIHFRNIYLQCWFSSDKALSQLLHRLTHCDSFQAIKTSSCLGLWQSSPIDIERTSFLNRCINKLLPSISWLWPVTFIH